MSLRRTPSWTLFLGILLTVIMLAPTAGAADPEVLLERDDDQAPLDGSEAAAASSANSSTTGMVVSSAHGDLPKGDNINEILDAQQAIGSTDLIVAFLPPDRFADRAAVESVAEDLNSAWSINDVEFKAKTKDGRDIHSRGYETMIWRKRDGGWRIVHSHSSTRKVKK